MQQILANIPETVWQNPQRYKKMKDKMKIYARPKNYCNLVVKKCNKEIWQAHLTSTDTVKDLRTVQIYVPGIFVDHSHDILPEY